MSSPDVLSSNQIEYMETLTLARITSLAGAGILFSA